MITNGKKNRKANRDYWVPKIERTIKRDKANVKKLEDLGYKVFRFWEHEIKKIQIVVLTSSKFTLPFKQPTVLFNKFKPIT